MTVDEYLSGTAALYALGTLTQHEARGFELSLAESNGQLHRELAAYESIVAELALSAPPQAPAPSLRTKLLGRVATLDANGNAEPVARPSFSVRVDEGKWRQTGPGVSVKKLFTDGERGTITSLVRMMPGTSIPRHRHHGTEEIIVLEGDCRVNGQIHTPGDYRNCVAGTVDSAVTTEGGTLFLMIAPERMEFLPDAQRM